MGIKVNIGDDVQPWGSDDILREGEYVVVVEDATEGTSGEGNAKVDLTFRCAAGPCKGGVQWDNLTFHTEKALGKVLAFMNAAGVQVPKGEFNFPTAKLKGKKLGLVVKEREDNYQGQKRMRNKVVAYKAADKVDGGDGGAGLVSRATSQLGATSMPVADDDDIPF